MTENIEPENQQIDALTGKPRIVLMGEFSAGKSTLSNILLGSAPLPMRVTATRLPPVHLSFGEPSAFAIEKDGERIPFELSDLDSVSLDEVQSIHLTMEADILQLCDIVDMPGISDPNMPKDMWEKVADDADYFVWCTHATQAWRQSEAAIWEMLQERTVGKNLLLITQFDKLRNKRDRARVLKRVEAETEGMFAAVYPVSLLSALSAADDFEIWKKSGAAAFTEHMVEILLTHETTEKAPDASQESEDATNPDPVKAEPSMTESAGTDEDQTADPQPIDAAPGSPVIPRRPKAQPGGSSRTRPDRRAAADMEL